MQHDAAGRARHGDTLLWAVEAAAVADLDAGPDHRMRVEDAGAADPGALAHHGVGADLRAFPDRRACADHRRRMDAGPRRRRRMEQRGDAGEAELGRLGQDGDGAGGHRLGEGRLEDHRPRAGGAQRVQVAPLAEEAHLSGAGLRQGRDAVEAPLRVAAALRTAASGSGDGGQALRAGIGVEAGIDRHGGGGGGQRRCAGWPCGGRAAARRARTRRGRCRRGLARRAFGRDGDAAERAVELLRHLGREVEGRLVEDHQRARQHHVDAAARGDLPDHAAERLLDLHQGALRHLLDGAGALAEDALAFRDAVLEVALALAELLRRHPGALVGELLLLLAPAVLLALEVLVQLLAAALDLLAHLVEGGGVALDLRHVHDADHRRRRRLARRQRRCFAACGAGLGRPLLLLRGRCCCCCPPWAGRWPPWPPPPWPGTNHSWLGCADAGIVASGGEQGAEGSERGAAGWGNALCWHGRGSGIRNGCRSRSGRPAFRRRTASPRPGPGRC